MYNGYLFCLGENNSIMQYKIIKEEDNNFIELKKIAQIKKESSESGASI